MSREDVESVFKVRDGGPQGITSTRYYASSGLIVEVPYDQTGGAWMPTNRVTGNVSVTLGSRSTL